MTSNQRWLKMEGGVTEWWVCRGRECAIALIKRPSYCDRGNFLAQLHTLAGSSIHIDAADGWPRYYFDEQAARSECEAWVRKRRQWVDDLAALPPLRAFGMEEPTETPGEVPGAGWQPISGAEFVDAIRDALPDAFTDLTDALPGSSDDYRALLHHIGPRGWERDE